MINKFVKLNLSKQSLFNTCLIFFICLNIYTLQIDKISFMSLKIMILSLMASFYIFIMNRCHKFNKLQMIWFIGILGLLLSCFNSTYQVISIKFSLYFLVAVMLMIFLSFSANTTIKSIRFHRNFSVVYMVFTLFQLLNFNGYISVMKRLFSSENIVNIENLSMLGRVGGKYVGIGLYAGDNAFILILGLGIILLSLIGNKRKHSLITYIIIILYVGSILLTGSRAMLLASIFSLVLVTSIVKHDTLIKKIKLFSIAIGLISVIIIICITFVPQTLVMYERFSNGNGSIDNRFILYRYALQLFNERPLFGQGINTFLSLTYTNSYMIENTYVHNVFLQLLCEIGIAGTILMLIPIVITWINTIKILKASEFISGYIEFEVPLKISLYVQTVFVLYFFSGNPLYDYNILLIYLSFCAIPMGCYTKYKQFEVTKTRNLTLTNR